MKNIEFYITPTGGIMVHDKKGTRPLSETNRVFITEMITKLNEFYPEALSSLSILYGKSRHNIPHFEYLIVSRFLRCNFGKFDNTLDIDQFGNFNIEEVNCPLRGECKSEGIICNPRFNSKLSPREIEVMEYFYNGYTAEKIAERLFLSETTIKTHRRNALRRTETHSLAEFFIFAKDKKIFNKQQ